MKSLKYLLKKEFTQIRRNTFMARMIIMMPIVQMLVLVPAVTFDIKEIDMCVVDQDQSSLSHGLVNKLQGSSFFKIKASTFSLTEAEAAMHRNDVDIIVHIPNRFEADYMRENHAPVQLLINAIDGTFAQTALSYCSSIIADYQQDILVEYINVKPVQIVQRVHTQPRYWYNPELRYEIYMAPGILAILVTAIGFLLSGLNLVREKEIGTNEQINVTPIKKHEFILGKMIPFMVIGIIDLAFGLTLAALIYKMPIEGNLLLLFAFALIFLIAVMGLGLFLSTFAATQQQYLFIAFFFTMIFILMSGIFTPADSMPHWAQKMNYFNPPAYFIRAMRMILLKGSGLTDVAKDMLLLGGLAVMTTGLASMKYQKTN